MEITAWWGWLVVAAGCGVLVIFIWLFIWLIRFFGNLWNP
jgi:hypothetical protein